MEKNANTEHTETTTATGQDVAERCARMAELYRKEHAWSKETEEACTEIARACRDHGAELQVAAPLTSDSDAQDAARYRLIRAGFGDFGPDVDLHNAFIDGGEKLDAALDDLLRAQSTNGVAK